MDATRQEEAPEDWAADEVRLRSGATIPVRATSPRRRRWSELPEAVTAAIVTVAGSTVTLATSTGSGFTAGFASRLDLADGRRIFVKAASGADDRLHGWDISAAYRLEARNLQLLPPESGAVPLLWTITPHDGTDEWIVLGFPYVAGHPPRRPWRPEELRPTTERLADAAPALASAPPGLDLHPFDAATEADLTEWTTLLHARDGRTPWVEEVLTLAAESSERCRGTAVVHGDLRDDNVIVGDDGTMWVCDWNWPVLGAPWLDLVTVVIAAHGDGLDTDAVLADHVLTRDVDPRSIDAWLAALWCYFTTQMEAEVPHGSPHLRDHQAWYADVCEDWLTRRTGLSRASR
jgi:hypothetical protein